LSAPLLSRFDLVFVLVDKSDQKHDTALTNHLLNIRSSKNPRGVFLDQAFHHNSISSYPEALATPADSSLASRLCPPANKRLDPVPHQIFRKYVAYARANCHPVLSRDAAEVLQNFYVDLRKNQGSSSDAVPITMRQLESLVRLTEARARLELRDVATVRDAEDVVELMKRSILQTHVDQYGKVEFEVSTTVSINWSELRHVDVKASNFGPHGNFGAFLARSVASLGE
jgi:DNA helicase MCM8